MNGLILLLTLLTNAPGPFLGADAEGRPSWCITSNLCVATEFESRIPENTNSSSAVTLPWVIEMRDHLTNRADWYRIGAPINGPTTNRQTLSVPAPATGPWYFRLRQLTP